MKLVQMRDLVPTLDRVPTSWSAHTNEDGGLTLVDAFKRYAGTLDFGTGALNIVPEHQRPRAKLD